MIKKEDLFVAGKLLKTHGVKGEICLLINVDVLADSNYFICEIDGLLIPFYIEKRRTKSDTVDIVKIEGVDSESDASIMLGSLVYLPKELQEEIEQASYSFFIGYSVVADGQNLGKIVSVDNKTANVLFEIKSATDDYMIPVTEDFIESIDKKKKCIYMCLPDGLLSIN